ncbi:MAG: S9 family peptidase [Anaerolineales bacterium]|nr:S9 family peptidase [Anaerolineales bacterium]
MKSRTELFGLWPSMVTPELLGRQTGLVEVKWDSDGETLVWQERRPDENTLLAQHNREAPRNLNGGIPLRPGIGYGGGAFSVRDGLVIFASNGQLFCQSLEQGLPQTITPAYGDLASPVLSPDGKQVLYVHSYENIDVLALVDSQGRQWPVRLIWGADFYMQPVWHPDSRQIAWVEWDHPQMPWEGSRLKRATLSNAKATNIELIAGNKSIPVFQPEFSPDGRWLSYIAQEGEWDRLYLFDLESGENRTLVEGGALMTPAWVQGLRTYAWAGKTGRLIYTRHDRGKASLWLVEVDSGKTESINSTPYTWIEQLSVSDDGENLAFIGSSPTIPPRIVSVRKGKQYIEARSMGEIIPTADISEPQEIQWPAPDGTSVSGLYYPPTSSRFKSDQALPPAIVFVHGGPTVASTHTFNPNAVFWTNRGYAFLEVNYRGSTFFGRSFLLALGHNWGKVDVEDVLGGGQALVNQGLADPQRLVVMGGSAGGYTVLNTLIRKPGFFKAGVNRYGVADLLIPETYKFELYYYNFLVGSLPLDIERFRDWSPINHVDRISDPLAVFQGTDDKVVSPENSERIVAALRARGIPHVYHLYEGEGHGFRKPENIADYYATVEAFLQKHVLYA